MNSDDISKSEDEWEILKLGGIDNELRVLPSLSLGELGWINDLEGANEHLVRDSSLLRFDSLFVWERCINDDTIEVAKLNRCAADLGELGVVVLKEVRLVLGKKSVYLLCLHLWWSFLGLFFLAFYELF